MSGPHHHYQTHDGQPPNGGLPPGYAPLVASRPPQYTIPTSFQPAQYLPPTTNMFLPPQQAPPQVSAPTSPTYPAGSVPGTAKYGLSSPDFAKANRTHFKITWERDLDVSNPVGGFPFTIWSVPSDFPVGQLIRDMALPSDPAYGITEFRECGGGRFEQVQTIFASTDRARKSLKKVGWGSDRGTAAKPVWIKACMMG
ncbi:MAG: hypothetical protein Q9169_005640 [Polycauliona sp. 2 TL-2023]